MCYTVTRTINLLVKVLSTQRSLRFLIKNEKYLLIVLYMTVDQLLVNYGAWLKVNG